MAERSGSTDCVMDDVVVSGLEKSQLSHGPGSDGLVGCSCSGTGGYVILVRAFGGHPGAESEEVVALSAESLEMRRLGCGFESIVLALPKS